MHSKYNDPLGYLDDSKFRECLAILPTISSPKMPALGRIRWQCSCITSTPHPQMLPRALSTTFSTPTSVCGELSETKEPHCHTDLRLPVRLPWGQQDQGLGLHWMKQAKSTAVRVHASVSDPLGGHLDWIPNIQTTIAGQTRIRIPWPVATDS